MSKKEKLMERFMDYSTSITYDELKHLLELLGFQENHGGRSSGSLVCFVSEKTGKRINMHRPHPGNEIKRYVRKEVRDYLEMEGYL